MRFNLTNLLQGVFYTTLIVLLALSACGGGSSPSNSPAPIPSYTVGGAVSGVQGTGLMIRDNGGDDLTIASGVASYTFATPITQGKSYNVTVLTYPTSPTQKCTVANPSAAIAANVTNANVTCNNAYTVGGTITGLTGTGLVLQNNGGDNVLVAPAPASTAYFTFNTPLITSDTYNITILTQPRNLLCSVGNPSSGQMFSTPVSVPISCAPALASSADPYVYAVNSGSSGAGGISTYNSVSGVLSSQTLATTTTEGHPSAIAIDAGTFAYVANSASNSLSGFSIASGVLATLPDVDAGTPGNQSSIATGSTPHAVVVHPSGKFVYVANYGSGASAGSISAYSIDPLTGALASIDADQAAGNQPTIATQNGPQSLAVTASGAYLYVANALSNTVSAYGINLTTGALALINSLATGTNPYSIAIDPDPAAAYLYVANQGSNDIWGYNITGNGTLSPFVTGSVATGPGPHSIVVDPTGTYAYVVATNSTNSAQVWAYSIGTGSTAGILTTTGIGSVAAGTSPISITLDSTGSYAYVANLGSNNISVFSVSNGVLSPINCSSPPSACTGFDFTAGAGPAAIATSR